MSDHRRNRRPDTRQTWDDSDRRDRHEPRDRGDYGRDRDRNRDQDRRQHRSRSRDRRGPRDRSRSPDRRYRDRDSDRNRGGRDRGGDRDRDGRNGPRRHDDRDGRDRRRDEPEGRDRRGPHRDGASRRSASPHRGSPPPPSRADSALPTRSRPEKKATSMAFKVNRRSTSPSHSAAGGRADDRDVPMRGAGDDGHRDRHDNGGGGGGGGRNRHEEDGRSPDDRHEDEDKDEDIEVEGADDMAAMQAMLGFGGFGSTKGKKIAGNDAGGVRKEKKTEYRQYMNRQGGFNRPLSPGR
ncbi:U4/U6.U5 tri-snRNP-associated protein 3-like protein [Paramyrothecium foliicola]|nr:U4/U6.U5 tri-snRNP-associated protein 3-like protein [Paramyrothecium foliicola]